jgi:hypothetical protein
MQKIKPYLTLILIAILVLIILLQRSCSKMNFDSSEPKVTVKVDTVYKHVHDTITKKVTVYKKQYVHINKPEYYPGETIDTCKARFQNLLKEHLVRTIYSDTLKLDSLGTIVIRDTVWTNKLYGKRGYTKNYKIPQVTKTITITKQEEPKKQLYVGLNGFVNRTNITAFSPGFIYKTKKDHIYQASIGVDFNGTITYGLGTYWKIKIK